MVLGHEPLSVQKYEVKIFNCYRYMVGLLFFLSGPNCAKFCLSKGQTVCFKIYLHLQLVDPKGYPFMMEIPWLGKKPRVLEELSA